MLNEQNNEDNDSNDINNFPTTHTTNSRNVNRINFEEDSYNRIISLSGDIKQRRPANMFDQEEVALGKEVAGNSFGLDGGHQLATKTEEDEEEDDEDYYDDEDSADESTHLQKPNQVKRIVYR